MNPRASGDSALREIGRATERWRDASPETVPAPVRSGVVLAKGVVETSKPIAQLVWGPLEFAKKTHLLTRACRDYVKASRELARAAAEFAKGSGQLAN